MNSRGYDPAVFHQRDKQGAGLSDDLHRRVQPPQRPGNGQCRIDVAAGSPAGQYDFHAFASLARSMTICLNTRPRSGKLANMS